MSKKPNPENDPLFARFINQPVEGVRSLSLKPGMEIPHPQSDIALLTSGIAAIKFRPSGNFTIPLGLFKAVTFMGGDFVNQEPSSQRQAVTNCNVLYFDQISAKQITENEAQMQAAFEEASTTDVKRLRAQMMLLAKPSAAKVAEALMLLSENGSSSLPSQDLIAFQADTTRPVVNQLIGKFRISGYLTRASTAHPESVTPEGKTALYLISLGIATTKDNLEKYRNFPDSNPPQPGFEAYKLPDPNRSQLDDSHLEEVLQKLQEHPSVRTRKLPKGDTIFSEGNTSSNYFFLAEGIAVGYSEDRNARRYNGVIFKTPSIFEDPYSRNRITHQMTCETHTAATVLEIPRAAVQSTLTEDAVLKEAIELAIENDGKNHSLRSKIQGLELIDQRLAAVLLDIKNRLGMTVVEFNQYELGILAGVSRETTNRIISDWIKRGMLLKARGSTRSTQFGPGAEEALEKIADL